MNLRISLLFTLSASCLLTACTIGNGRICGPQTPAAHCDKEAYERLKYPKPYGAHWIKEGMTKESRREDIAECGAKGNVLASYVEVSETEWNESSVLGIYPPASWYSLGEAFFNIIG